MYFKVYRSLDRPSSFLGIKGKFIIIVGVFAGIFGFLGLILGNIFGNGLVGFGFFLGGTAVGVAVTLTLQGRMSVRQFSRFLSSRGLPDYIRIKPKALISTVDIIEK